MIAGAIHRRRKAEMAWDRQMNQELAHLVAFAYHAPKKMPDLTKEQTSVEMSEEESAARMRAALMGLVSPDAKAPIKKL